MSIAPGAVGTWGQAVRPCPEQIRSGPSPLPAGAREALLWKLDGLSEYDTRRLLTLTTIDLLGPVKHVASAELGYLGDTFRRAAALVRGRRRTEPGHVGDRR